MYFILLSHCVGNCIYLDTFILYPVVWGFLFFFELLGFCVFLVLSQIQNRNMIVIEPSVITAMGFRDFQRFLWICWVPVQSIPFTDLPPLT